MQTRRVAKPTLTAHCPYGNAGDRLWVRETWRVGAWDSGNQSIAVDYRADASAQREWLHVPDYDQFEGIWIASTDQAMAAGLPPDASGGFHWKPGEAPTVWRPSIFMPRWASRISLEVVSVKIEQVQDISEEDAVAEGVQATPAGDGYPFAMSARMNFVDLWDDINAKRGYGWAENPYVWAITFKEAPHATT